MSALDEIRAERLRKLALLKERGVDAYPPDSRSSHRIDQVLKNFDSLKESGESITIGGRIKSLRLHGGSAFIDLYDGAGEIQAFLKKDTLGEEPYSLFTDTIDQSDFIEVTGTVFITKREERSVLASSWRLLSKSIRPVPDEWFGLKDEDERYRKRYLDILLDEKVSTLVRKRSIFWNTMRQFLLVRDFIEVETPVLETTTGGADARPFVTHHNALDIDVFLRISAGELWQKKLLVAGIPRTFEIGRIFRNEGMSHEHLQDYTQMEFYQAYADYNDGMKMIVELYRDIALKTFGTQTFTIGNFNVDLGGNWETYDYCALMEKEFGFDPRDTTLPKVREILLKANPKAAEDSMITLERAVDTLWKIVRKTIGGPGFLINVPVYLEPLAKRSSKDDRVVERFQILIAGSEMGKGFTELNDPIDQRERFTHQQALREQGDNEAQMNDETFIEALEYGMPPAFGFGVSERLFSFLANVSIREAQFFPLMRPK